MRDNQGNREENNGFLGEWRHRDQYRCRSGIVQGRAFLAFFVCRRFLHRLRHSETLRQPRLESRFLSLARDALRAADMALFGLALPVYFAGHGDISLSSRNVAAAL